MARNNKDYVGVHERVQQARTKYNDKLTIKTDLTVLPSVTDDGATIRSAVVTATAGIQTESGYQVLGTGTAFCDSLDGGDNDLEKAETKAVGRALAFAGFSAEKGIASAEEMEDVEETETLKAKKRGLGLGRKTTKAPVDEVEETEEAETEETTTTSTGSRLLARTRLKKAELNVEDSDETSEDEEEEEVPTSNPLSKFKKRRA